MKSYILKRAMLGGAAGALFAGSAMATSLFPVSATLYRTNLVRAMDPCVPSGVTIVGTVQDPSAGCLQANVVTDEAAATMGATFNRAILSVRKTAGALFHGRVRYFATGHVVGQRVKARLTIRGTRTLIHTKHPPGSNKRVTFADVTIDCGNQIGGCWAAHPNGVIVGSQNLDDCLAQNGQPINLRLGNLEILDAEMVNCDTGKVYARPGIKQAPNVVR